MLHFVDSVKVAYYPLLRSRQNTVTLILQEICVGDKLLAFSTFSNSAGVIYKKFASFNFQENKIFNDLRTLIFTVTF